MASNFSIDSVDSDIIFVGQLLNEPSPQRNNSPNTLNSTEPSETYTTQMPAISSVASPEPNIVIFDDDSNEPTMLHGFGRQLPIILPNPNDLNPPPNRFNILATKASVNPTGDAQDDNYSPPHQSHLIHRQSQHHP